MLTRLDRKLNPPRCLGTLGLLALLALPGLATTTPPSAATSLPQGTSCTPDWLAPDPLQGANNWVRVLRELDDGTGTALYAGGWFTTIGGIRANRIAKWDGTQWHALGSGFADYNTLQIDAVAMFDEGQGPRLFAAGQFDTAGGVPANNIARWDGTAWSAVGGGTTQYTLIHALEVFDDGSGPALYVGGEFLAAGGISAPGIAKWDGSTWSSVGPGGAAGTVYSLHVADLGTGPRLYAGGNFSSIGGVSASCVASWNGTSWSALGAGVAGSGATVNGLAVHNFGSGPELCVGGNFTTAGAVTTSNLARWDGSTWSALTPSQFTVGKVRALAEIDDGAGPTLFAGYEIGSAGGNLIRWNGTGWSNVGAGFERKVTTLTQAHDGTGPKAGVGGEFTIVDGGYFSPGGRLVGCLAMWNGSAWTGFGAGISRPVVDATVVDNGVTKELFASIDTYAWGGDDCNIARWDGSSWRVLYRTGGWSSKLTSARISGTPRAIVTTLRSGYPNITWIDVSYWTGAVWSSLGSFDAQNGVVQATVDDMLEFTGNGTPQLVVAGKFDNPARNIAMRTGTNAWSSLGSGLSGKVRALAQWDSGNGLELYAAGKFQMSGGVAVNRVARWNGTTWSSVGAGLDGEVFDLVVFDDGSGATLHAAGAFGSSNGQSIQRVAKWNGSSWVPLGSGTNDVVEKLTVFDDGTGPALIASGLFTSAGGAPANGIARWDGTSWSALGAGTQEIDTLTVFDFGSGEQLLIGGPFKPWPNTTTGPGGGAGLAAWGCPAGTTSTTYCTAGTSSNGCTAAVSAVGQASASANSGFVVSIDQVEGLRSGLFFYGLSGPQTTTWNGGTSRLCVRAPSQRLIARNSGGTAGACDGFWSDDWNTFRFNNPGALGQPFLGGETVWLQGWFRDPAAPGFTNLSNALVFPVAP